MAQNAPPVIVHPIPQGDDVARAVAFGAGMLGLMLRVDPDRFLLTTRGNVREAFARQILMHVLAVELEIAEADIARAFARDPSTVRHAVAVIEELRELPGFDSAMAWLGECVARGWRLMDAYRAAQPLSREPEPRVVSVSLER